MHVLNQKPLKKRDAVFMKLLLHQKEFHDSDHLRRWLIRVAINECNSLWTSSWRKRVELKEFSERDMAGNESFYNSEYEDLYTARCHLSCVLLFICFIMRNIQQEKLLLCCIFSRQPFVPDYRGHVNF